MKWIATINGLASFDGNDWNTYLTSNSGLPANHVTGLAIDSDNNKWIATFDVGGGLAKFDGTNWTVYNISNTSIWDFLRTVATEPNGNVWVGTNGFGMAVLNENGLTSVEQINDAGVEDYSLNQNYPNPFNPSTNIQFSLPQSSFVTLEVFNLISESVGVLVSEELNAGTYNYSWNAKALPSGIYFYKLQAGNFTQTKKMILLK